jgi:hypothetical protein
MFKLQRPFRTKSNKEIGEDVNQTAVMKKLLTQHQIDSKNTSLIIIIIIMPKHIGSIVT